MSVVAAPVTFTVQTCSMRWRMRERDARMFLLDFAERGFVVEVADDAWVVTDAGRAIGEAMDELAREVASL